MTKLLERAFEKVRNLPEADQDAIAQIVLDEIESERHWDELFSKSGDKVCRIADAAWVQHEAGKSAELKPDEM